jgi:hypothetical protein
LCSQVSCANISTKYSCKETSLVSYSWFLLTLLSFWIMSRGTVVHSVYYTYCEMQCINDDTIHFFIRVIFMSSWGQCGVMKCSCKVQWNYLSIYWWFIWISEVSLLNCSYIYICIRNDTREWIFLKTIYIFVFINADCVGQSRLLTYAEELWLFKNVCTVNWVTTDSQGCILVCVLTVTPQLFIGVIIGFILVALNVSTHMDHIQVLRTYNIEKLLIWHVVTSVFVLTYFL